MNGLPLVGTVTAAVGREPREERLSSLVEAHYDRLYRLGRRLSRDTDSAQDLVQETFLKAARALSSIPDGPSGAEAWLVRVLVNIRRDQWRRIATRRRLGPDAGCPQPVDAGHERALIARTAVWQALDKLDPRRRAIVVMHEIEGLAPSAIAPLLGIASVTVRWHLSRGRRELARYLRS
jgi:RNA polymerase sigma-70 factor (ECF subfamily)